MGYEFDDFDLEESWEDYGEDSEFYFEGMYEAEQCYEF